MDDSPRDAQENNSEAENTNPATHQAPNGAKAASEVADEATTGDKDLATQLTEAQAKANEYLDGWQRARADFANYRKRAEKERDEVYQTASVETLRKLLPVIDDFDRAITSVPADKASDDVIKGFSLIHRKLMSLLESSGVTVINPMGEEFNPAFHEAIGQDESSDVKSGHITVVLQKGYLHGNKVLRPALVRVAQ